MSTGSNPGSKTGWSAVEPVSRPTSAAAAVALHRVRELCLAFPGTSERLSHGEQSWFVKKQFVTFADHHHDERVACWAAAPEGAQDRWVVQHPERFFVPPYVGRRGWVGVYLDVEQDWADVAEIVESAYLEVAPVTLRRAWTQRDG